MRLGDLVVRLAPVLLALEQAAALHEAQVFGGHVAGDAARLGKLPDRVAAPQEHLDHAQPVRVGQRLEAFRRLLQSVQGRELRQLRGLGRGSHSWPSYTPIYRKVTTCQAVLRFFSGPPPVLGDRWRLGPKPDGASTNRGCAFSAYRPDQGSLRIPRGYQGRIGLPCRNLACPKDLQPVCFGVTGLEEHAGMDVATGVTGPPGIRPGPSQSPRLRPRPGLP